MDSLLFVKFNLFLVSNPFFDAYFQSDIMGKLIYLTLIIISIVSWVIIIHKVWQTHQARKESFKFKERFYLLKQNPLTIECTGMLKNPFMELYLILKKYTLDILKKNQQNGATTSYLSPSDIEFVDAHLHVTVASQIKTLEKNLFILSTIVGLGPFMGLLGTVWGIITTFGELQTQMVGGTQQAILGGLSLALATTVLGLVDAIPALIGYNYLKNTIRDFQTDMEGFSIDILATVEMQYRKVDVT